MPDPTNATAPNLTEAQGGAEIQRAADESILADADLAQWVDPAFRATRPDIRGDQRRGAALALSAHMNGWEPSEGWTRRWLNELAQEWNFDPEYLERRYGVSRKGVAA